MLRKINFSGFPHSMSFPPMSHTLGNWQENSCVSHMMKYTTGWQSNGKSHPFYGKSVETNFSGIPHSMGFTLLWGSWWENPFIFHVMKYTIGWESNGKKHPHCGAIMSTNSPGSPRTMSFLGYYWEPILQTFPIRCVWSSFPMLWEINEKTHAFPMWWGKT